MDIYLYCTYEHSVKGFFPAYLGGSGLVPADGSRGITLPDNVSDFFSYDRFKILWREYPDGGSRFFPTPGDGFFGVRRIEGSFGGRHGISNIAFMAGSDELRELEDIASFILSRYEEFSLALTGSISVGGDCGYELDAERFLSYLRGASNGIDFKKLLSFPGGKMLKKILEREGGIFKESDLLRFAVTSERWTDIYGCMGGSRAWKKQPRCVITPAEFEENFLTTI